MMHHRASPEFFRSRNCAPMEFTNGSPLGPGQKSSGLIIECRLFRCVCPEPLSESLPPTVASTGLIQKTVKAKRLTVLYLTSSSILSGAPAEITAEQMVKINRRTNIPRSRKRSIRAGKQRTKHAKSWRSAAAAAAATVISHTDSISTFSGNVDSKERVSDALERQVLGTCSKNSSGSRVERERTSDATSQGIVGARMIESSLEQSFCPEKISGAVITQQSVKSTVNQSGEVERTASERISCPTNGEQLSSIEQKLDPVESGLIQSEKNLLEDAIEVDVPSRPNDGSSFGNVQQSKGNPSGVGLCNGHHAGCDTRGISAACRRHSTGVYTRSVETVSLRQASYGVHPMPAVDGDSRGLVGLGFEYSTAVVTTLKPVDVASAAVYVTASVSSDEVDAPLSCVEETDHGNIEPASPSPYKGGTSCSGNRESDVIFGREPERRESDALSMVPSLSSNTKEDQRAGGIHTQEAATTSDASTSKTSGTPQEASLPSVNLSADLDATKENGTALLVPRDISHVGMGAISGATDQSLEETNNHRSSELEVGETMAIEAVQELHPSPETAFHNHGDMYKMETTGKLGEQSSVGGLCDTEGGSPLVDFHNNADVSKEKTAGTLGEQGLVEGLCDTGCGSTLADFHIDADVCKMETAGTLEEQSTVEGLFETGCGSTLAEFQNDADVSKEKTASTLGEQSSVRGLFDTGGGSPLIDFQNDADMSKENTAGTLGEQSLVGGLFDTGCGSTLADFQRDADVSKEKTAGTLGEQSSVEGLFDTGCGSNLADFQNDADVSKEKTASTLGEQSSVRGLFDTGGGSPLIDFQNDADMSKEKTAGTLGEQSLVGGLFDTGCGSTLVDFQNDADVSKEKTAGMLGEQSSVEGLCDTGCGSPLIDFHGGADLSTGKTAGTLGEQSSAGGLFDTGGGPPPVDFHNNADVWKWKTAGTLGERSSVGGLCDAGGGSPMVNFHVDVDVCKGKTAGTLGERSSVEGLCDTGGGSPPVDFHNNADVSKEKTACMLVEQSSVGGLCDTGGCPPVVAARCSPREDEDATRELPILRRSTRRRSLRLILRDVGNVKHSQQNLSSHDNAGVSATAEKPGWTSNEGSIVGKVEAVERTATLETPKRVDLSSSIDVKPVGKHATETPHSPSEKSVASERGAPEPQPESIGCTLGDGGARGSKCLAALGSNGGRDNDSKQRVRVLRRSQRRRSIGIVRTEVLTRNTGSFDADKKSAREGESSHPSTSQGMRRPPESETLWWSSTLPVAAGASPSEKFGDVADEVAPTVRETIDHHGATARDDTSFGAYYPLVSPSGEAFRMKPAGRRSTRRRSLGAVPRGDNVGLLRRTRGAPGPETDASESQGVTKGTTKAIRCLVGKDQLVRREHTSVQGALTLVDNAPGVSPWSSRTRSARLKKSTNDPSSSLRTKHLGDLSGSPVTNKRTVTLGPKCPVKGRQVGAISAVVKKCMSKMTEVGVEVSIAQERELQPLASLLAAIEAAEACCIKHEHFSAGIGEGRTSHTTAGRKRVHFCSFDLSSVDMPRDTTDGSEAPAKEIARCLARVTDAQSVVHDALRAKGSHNKGFVEKWKAFLCELRGLALHSEPEETAEQSKIGLVGAARFLLAELEPLETSKGPVYTALKGKLGNVLASLVRFNLRILLNPPPEKLSKPDADVSDRRRFSGRSARLAGPTHFSKVHEMVELDRGQPNASFTRALRRLYGYPGERAVEFVAEAESFLAEEASRGKKFGLETPVEKVRRHVIILADIVDAICARRFVRSLLNSDGVRGAIAEAGGWVDVEKLASDLKRLEGPADIHTPFTLLSDVEGFERWLDDESLWPMRAEGVLEKLLAFLAPVTERPKRRRMENAESVELLRQDALEVKQRAQFPAIKAAKHKISSSLEKVEQDRGNDADCRRTLRNKIGGANQNTRTAEGVIIAGELVRVNGGDSGSRLSRSKSSKKKNRRNSMF